MLSYTGPVGGAGAGQVVLGTVSGLSARQSTSTLNNTGSAFTLTVSGDTPKWTGLDSGNWQTGSTGANENWTLIAGGTPTTYLNNDDVRFDDSAAGTTTIDINAANVSPFATTFNNSTKNYTLGSTGAFGIASGPLTKTGTGTLTITNANSSSGITTITGGVLDVSTDGAQLYSGATPIASQVTVSNGGVLVVKHFGQGATTGPGSPSLGNLNNAGGQVVIDGGTLRFNNETSSRGRVINVGPNGATFDVVNSSTYTWSTSPGTSVPFSGSGQTLTLTGDATSTGQINLVIGGTNVSIVKNGLATWRLTGNNTYTGGTTISDGTLQATVTSAPLNALGSGAVSVGTGSTLILNNTTTTNGATTTVSNAFSGTGLLKLQFAANTNAKNTQMPNSAGFAGIIQLSSLGTTGDKWNASNLGTVAGALTVDPGNTLYLVSGTTSFSGGITLSGTGNNEGRGAIRMNNAILGGNITLAGDTTINHDNPNALLTGNITSGVAAPLTLTLGATGSTGGTLGGIIGGGTDVINLATAVAGTYTLTNANTYTGSTTIVSGTTLQLGNGTAGNDGNINTTSGVTNDGTLAFNPFGSVSSSYPISGLGAVVKNGAGTQTLSGANSFSGGTTVNAGILSLDYSSQDNSKLDDFAVLTLAGGTLNLSAGTHTEVVGSTTLAAGTASTVTSGGVILQMGVITPNAGASINFGASGIARTDTLNNADGILGTWATVNGSDYAVNSTNGVNGLITAPTYIDVTRLNGGTQIIPDGSASFVRIIEGTGSPANLTLAAATTSIATLTQSTVGGSSAATINPAGKTLATSAILSASGAGPLTIGTGTNNGNVQALTAGGDLGVTSLGTTTVTLNSVVADNAGSTLTKIGAGTLVLNAANTHAGGTTLGEGTLRLGNAAALGAGAFTIAGGSLDSSVVNLVNSNNNPQSWGGNFGFIGTQNLDLGTGAVTLNVTPQVNVSGGTLTVGGVIGGSFGIAKTGPGTLTLTAANEYTGTTTVTDGVLNLTGNRISTPAASSVGIDVGGTDIPMATLNIQGDIPMGSSQFRVGLLGPGTVNHTSGNVIYTGGNHMTIGTGAGFASFYNFSGGSIVSAASATRGLLIASNANCIATFNLSGTANLDLATGASLLSLGRSDSTVNGSNATFNQTGGTATVGTLTIGGAASGSSGVTASLNLSDGQFTANAFTVLAAGNTNAATINISGTADVTLPAFPTARGTGSTATITLDGGTLRPAAASTAYMGGLTNAFIKAGGAKIDTGFDIAISQALLEDAISTGGGLTKEGPAALTLQGANTYTGVTSVNAGTITIGDANALGTPAGNTVVASGARLFVQSGVTNQIVPEPIILSGAGTDGTGVLRFGGGVTGVQMSGPITLAADALIKNDGSTTSTLSGGITIADKVLTFTGDASSTNTVSTAGISGSTGSVVKTGAGTLALAAAGTYSGGTSLQGGFINVNDSNALGTGTATVAGGVRYVLGDTVNVANAFDIGANAGAAGFGLIHVPTGTATVSGPINITSGATGGGHFGASGSAVLNLTGPITSTVTVSNRIGTIVHSGGGTGYTATNAAQGTVRLGANNGIATTATMTIGTSAAAVFDLAGFNQTMVGIAKGGSAATIGNSSTTSDSTLTLTGTSSYAGVIQDAVETGTMKVNLTVNGGQLTLSGANTYTGPTTVSAGTLAFVGGSQASPVTVSAGASLEFTLGSPTTSTSTFNLTNGTIKINGTATLNSYTLITSSAGITGTPVLDSPIAGYGLQVSGNSLNLVKLGYAAWAATNAPTGTANDDFDGDGVTNGVEYVLGGTKDTNDVGKQPKPSIDGGDMLFTFVRDQASIDGSTSVFIEVGNNLVGWSTAPSPYSVPDGAVSANPGVSVVKDSPVAGFDTVTLRVVRAPDTRKFARLRVVVP